MNQILKRLEIIKNSISIEDEEIVHLQACRLYNLDVDDEVKKILSLIKNTDFQNVIPLIDAYLRQFNSLVVYENEEIQGLKLELKILEKQLLTYSCRVEEYYNIINDFNVKYHLELGTLIEEVLILREEYYEFMYKNNIEYEYEYLEAKKDFEDFHFEFKNYQYETPVELSKKEKQELKRLYKKASRLCHPDIIEEKKRDKAEETFKILNEAYQQKDTKKVSEILEQLLLGESFSSTSDIVFDKEILKKKIIVTREQINSIKIEIENVKQNDTFVLVDSLDNLDEYFSERKHELLSEKENILDLMREYSFTA